MHSAIILLLLAPLAGGVFHALAGRHVPRWLTELAAVAVVAGAAAAAATALALGWEQGTRFTIMPWFAVSGFVAAADVLADKLALCMAVMVTFVSLVIHAYSVPFMRDDDGYVRYFCYLNLFVFFMLVIVLADNLVFLFLGWEGVGLCSYALIGFWYGESARTLAGNKAFTLTRIGDVAFLVAIGVVAANFGTPSISNLNQAAGGMAAGMATLLGLLMLWAATGKSAQLPLLVWLPDAMAGPSPVSALIHAATMVTAGVYLLMRLYPVLAASPTAMLAVAATGAVTALFAACAALCQRDIKRVLAWSTISQVGYMFLGVGAGDVTGTMFHLLVHAFFKSLLFMAAGCVILHLHEEHDIYRMGAKVRRGLPQTFWLFLFGCLALAGLPPSSGFFSKGRILLATLAHGGGEYTVLWVVGTLAALLTALYTFRLLFLVFFGGPGDEAAREARADRPPARGGAGEAGILRMARGLVTLLTGLFLLRFVFRALFDEKADGGDGGGRAAMAAMQSVLWPLGILALVAGALNLPGEWPVSNWLGRFLGPAPGVAAGLHGAPEALVDAIDAVIALTGLVAAWFLWGPGDRVGRRHPVEADRGIGGALLAGFGLDDLYRLAVARPYRALSNLLWRGVDERWVDGANRGAAALVSLASRGARLASTGRMSTYLVLFLLGAAAVLAVMAGRLLW